MEFKLTDNNVAEQYVSHYTMETSPESTKRNYSLSLLFEALTSPDLFHRPIRERKYNTIYPIPPLGQDMTQGQFLSGV